jgi:hypothetical protein
MTESNEEEMCSLYSNYGNHDDHMLMEPVDMIVEKMYSQISAKINCNNVVFVFLLHIYTFAEQNIQIIHQEK